jgi:predicted nucleotidyltransferase
MNTIRHDLPENIKDFFKKLSNYLDTELYFYGSINRSDYVHDKSDIDVAIFTDNENSIISKLQHFLHVKRNAFDKVVWKLNGTIVYGYKIKCDDYIDIKCEIAIYNNDFKDILLPEMNVYIPIYISILLFILKTMYYTFPILSNKTYADYKRILFNKMVLKKESVFFVLKQNKSKNLKV